MKLKLNLSSLKFTGLCLVVLFTWVSAVQANEDLEEGQKSKELVEEVKKKEGELRDETEKKITPMRELALKHLEKFHKQFLDQKKQAEAESIAIEINNLRTKLGIPLIEVTEKSTATDTKNNQAASNDKQNYYFKFNVNYGFDEKGIIKGKFVFSPNQKVTISYIYKNNAEETTTSVWKDMGDHIQIDSDKTLGQILISTNPSSNQNTLTIRWGGELSNKITEANAQ